MLTRRGFLGALAALVVAKPTVQALVPGPAVTRVVAAAVDAQTGISLRYVQHYNILADKWPTRLDVFILGGE